MGRDDRSSIPTYAKKEGFSPSQLERDFSGVGSFDCAGERYTAQLSGGNDVITTAAHAFYLDDCRPVVTNGKPCQFQLEGSPEKYDVYIDWDNLENSPDPRNARLKCPKNSPDAAVLKLKKPVPNTAFFHVRDSGERMSVNTEIIQLSTKSTSTAPRGFQRLAQSCLARKFKLDLSGSLIVHDCDTEPGTSGGAQVVFDKVEKKFYLFGIHRGPNAHVDSSAGPKGSALKDYDGDKNANLAVPVKGDVLAEIKRMIRLDVQSSNLGQ